jgi:response regulator RpfG family c-di-GMP phosphodiesterase
MLFESEEKLGKILIVDDDPGARDVIHMIVEAHFSHKVFEISSLAKLKETLAGHSDISLIIGDYELLEKLDEPSKKLYFQSQDIPLLLMSRISLSEDHALKDCIKGQFGQYLKKPFRSSDLVTKVTTLMNLKKKDFVKEFMDPKEKFVRISFNKFLKYQCHYAVYIKLSEQKLVKIREENDSDITQVQRYALKNIEHLYIEKEDYEDLVERIMSQLFRNLEDLDLSAPAGTEGHLNSIEEIHEVLRQIGINEKTIDYVDKIIANTLSMMEKKPKFKELIKLLNSHEGYTYSHAHLCAYIGCALVDQMDWKNDTIKYKIVIASLFQNITLNSPKLAKIFDVESKEYKDLSDDEKQLVRRHMIEACDLLETLPEFTYDAKSAILNHHELPNGSGFPRGLSSRQVSPLDALFIIAVNFSHDLLTVGDIRRSFKKLIESYRDRFSVGKYEGAYKAMLTIFLKVSLEENIQS